MLQINSYTSRYPYNSKTSIHKNTSSNTISEFRFNSGLNYCGTDKKISFQEGASLIWSGIKQQVRDIGNMLFTNPKTLLFLVGLTAAMAVLPAAGIPASVIGGFLAVCFAAASTAKTIKHCHEFTLNHRRGQYNLARKNLKNIGEDSVNLALSIPFTPSAIFRLKIFKNFGKIQLDKELFKNKTIVECLDALDTPGYNTNLERKITFKWAAAKELKNTPNTNSVLKKELEAYNVPFDELPQVTLENWAKKYNIYTQPKFIIKTLPENVAGMAVKSNCTIYLNDYKTKITSMQRYITQNTKLENDTYIFTYLDTQTGKLFSETIARQPVDDYNALITKYKTLTPEVARIITTIHEREHIDQFARIALTKGLDTISPKEQAKAIYKNMLKEMANQKRTIEKTEETAKIIAEQKPPETFVQYIKSPLETAARRAEKQAMDNPFYTHLDNIYRTVNAKTPAGITRPLLTNTVQAEAIAS